MAKTRTSQKIYFVWRGMKRRCFDRKSKSYSDYGHRGISVSDSWLDFDNFAADMAKAYKNGLTLERVDNNKGYCKENCRWATWAEQENNRRNTKWIEFKGELNTLSYWIKHFNLKSSTVRQRLYVYHWPLERCFA